MLNDNRHEALIIEDSVDLSDLMGKWLMAIGCRARVVDNRDSALHLLRQYSFSIILMDYRMPGMSAEEFVPIARVLRPESIMLLMTADPNAYELAAKMRISYVLNKPFDDDFLTSTVERLLTAKMKFPSEIKINR